MTLLNQRVGRFCDFDLDRLRPDYLRYALLAPKSKQYFENHAYGVAQPKGWQRERVARALRVLHDRCVIEWEIEPFAVARVGMTSA